MALRGRLPAEFSEYPLPVRGVNLRDQLPQIRPDEAQLLQNLNIEGGWKIRDGSGREISAALQSGKRIRGLTKYYYGGPMPQGKRVAAYGTSIATIEPHDVITVLTTGMSDDRDTHFTTWSITDRLYISNSTDVLRSYDGNTGVFQTVTGTNIPTPRAQIIGVLDRLFCITTDGIERTNARDDSTWSKNSSWATLRGSQSGLFTALHPIMLRGADTLYHGALAFQPNSFYLIQGTTFGTDVTSATAPTDGSDNASIQLMNTNVGTLSPYSIEEVPDLGLFWFTSDKNVFWMRHGSLTGSYIGDKIQAAFNREETGIESTSLSYINQVWMRYLYPYLMLGFPSSYVSHTDIQYWLDTRQLLTLGPVWHGPMIGQSLSRVFVERQLGDRQIIAGEGDPTKGAWIYRLRKPQIYSDASGASDTDIAFRWRSFYNPFGAPEVEKRIRSVHMDINDFAGSATVSLWDIDGEQLADAPIQQYVES